MPDAHANFAYSTVAMAPSPANSGTSLTVQSGDGASFPTPPFNATVWPAGANPRATNAEIVRVTAIATDTLTITRTQEGTSARTVLVGDQIAATITAKTLTDAEGPLSLSQPINDICLPANSQLQLNDDPYVIASGNLADISKSNVLLWMNSTKDFENLLNLLPQQQEPTISQTLYSGWTAEIDTDPLIVDSGYLVTLNPGAVIWLNGPRCPTTVSTLLVIGV